MGDIKFDVGGIKCDNPSCDYRDDSVSYEDYQDWLNKPCPCCGENLLTQEDLDNFKETMNQFKMMEEITSLYSEDELKIVLENMGIDINNLHNLPIFENAEGVENLNGDLNQEISIEFDTRTGEVSKIEKVETEEKVVNVCHSLEEAREFFLVNHKDSILCVKGTEMLNCNSYKEAEEFYN